MILARHEHFIAELTDVSQNTTPDMPKWLYPCRKHYGVVFTWSAFGMWRESSVFCIRGVFFAACEKRSECFSRNAKTTPQWFLQGCRVVFPYHQLWLAYPFTTDRYRVFNVSKKMCIVLCRTHEDGGRGGGGWRGSGTQTNLYKSWLGGDRKEKLMLTLSRQGIEPRLFGLESRRSNHWATSPKLHLSSFNWRWDGHGQCVQLECTIDRPVLNSPSSPEMHFYTLFLH